MPVENIPILEALEECLSLRDKYMSLSGQKLGFNPRDHDGVFGGLDDDIAGVCGVHPDADYAARPPAKSSFRNGAYTLDPLHLIGSGRERALWFPVTRDT